MAHKDIIVRLHLDGHSVAEIARFTHYSARAVDDSTGTSESMLIFCLFSFPIPLMSRLLQMGGMLVNGYFELIEEFFDDKERMRTYLQLKGVQL